MRRKMILLVTAIAMIVAAAAPAGAEPRGFVEDELHFGFFYANFDAGVSVFAGGPVESFCDGDPGTAPLRVFERKDGSVDLMVDARNQPIWVYESFLEPPVLVEQVCSGRIAPPAAFATGTANLKVRISILTNGVQEVVNGVNGKATAGDGTQWKVRTWADLTVIDGIPQGDPAEFQGVKIHKIGG
jgi:hypothetical protein